MMLVRPAMRDHLSRETTFAGQKGWSPKTGSTVYHKINTFEMWHYRRMLRKFYFSYHKYCCKCTTENWCKGNKDVKQPEKQKAVLCKTHNEKHIRTL